MRTSLMRPAVRLAMIVGVARVAFRVRVVHGLQAPAVRRHLGAARFRWRARQPAVLRADQRDGDAGLRGVVLEFAADDRFDVRAREPHAARLGIAREWQEVLRDQLLRLSRHGRQGRRNGGEVRSLSVSARERAGVEPHRWLHLRHDSQRTWKHAALQPHRREGSLGRRELRARVAGQAAGGSSHGSARGTGLQRSRGSRSDDARSDASRTTHRRGDAIDERSEPGARARHGDTTRRTGADTTRAGARRTPGQGERE